jgi:tRNA(Ile)-lysidine synthetase-like protein
VIRPVLECRRAELREYLAGRGRTFREDASNADLAIPRNRIRAELLPLLSDRWPGSVRALARFAELAAADEAFLTRTALEVMPAVTLPSVDGVQRIDTRGLNQLPLPLARRIVRSAIERAGGTPSFRDIEAIRALARGDKRADRLDLTGIEVERDGHALMVLAARPAAARVGAFAYRLDVPGIVTVAETGTVIRASLITGAGERPETADGMHSVALQADRVAGPLTVRNRRPGDRVRPFGAPGSRKLQDVLVDRKIPREARDRVALVVDARGRILWVVGLLMAEAGRVRRAEAGMVVLESENQRQG